MFKTQLSSNLIPEKVIIAVVPVITFFSWAALPAIVAALLFVLMLVLVPYSIYTIYMAPLNLSYDESFLFVTSRKTEKIIRLKDIIRIEPSAGYTSLRKRWQISYAENSAEQELFFYPNDTADVSRFKKVARAKNPMIFVAD
ncbi:hypothetical protein [Mucilaginibacter ginsenosidivorans]|uniref:PH domain-containing protein n=1 Tax=Mucilaginibacter ginsenosidivorans TaxID=398053 RepID=A0A5B8UXF7_9SPHI|nr:hypothetical protein [Mucilaginibacter ginsenosidivorans]QEC63837.1 hypothetical protein FRZ54_15060 [Mucilaginibacter ginsenosidivorans]